DREVRLLDDVHGVLEELPLVGLDLLPDEPLRLLLVELRVQEAGVPDHARGVERDLRRERELVLPRREVAPPPAEDLPEVVPPEGARAALVRPRAGEDPRVRDL